MAIKKIEAIAKSTNGEGRCPNCFFSCFGASLSSQAMVAVPSRRWRVWGKKKKTVPVNSAGDAAPLPPLEVSPPTPVKGSSAVFHWLHIKLQHQDKKIEGPISTTHNNYQLQHPLTHNYQLHQVAPKFKTQMKPAATFHQIHEQIQRTHRSSLDPSHRSISTKISRASLHKKPSSTMTTTNRIEKLDSSTFGLLVIAVALTLLLVCGRTVTILFICTWLFFLARIRTVSMATETRMGGKEGKDVDSMSSKEYKKMVVLKGLLERDPKRKTK